MKIYSRTYARLIAVQVIYQFYFFEFNADVDKILEQTLDCYFKGLELNDTALLLTSKDIDIKFAKKLIYSCLENKDKVDPLLTDLLSTCSYVPGNIIYSVLRVGATELIFYNTKDKVVLSEFSNIAASLVPANKVGVVCAVLDRIAKMTKEEKTFVF